MSIIVQNYLENLEDLLQHRRTFHDGSTMLCDDTLVNRQYFPGFSKNEIETANLPNGTGVFIKRYYSGDTTSKEYITNEVVFSRLYNALGVNALKYYPVIMSEQSGYQDFGQDVAVVSQDLKSIEGLNCEPFLSAHRSFYDYIRKYCFTINQILANQKEFLNNCCDRSRSRDLLVNFVKTGMLDIICMMVDNHLGNKSLVRRDRIAIPEDIISFDLEDSSIDLFNNSSYLDFIYELSHSEDAYLGDIRMERKPSTYMGYLQKMKDMRDDGILPPECIELLDNIVNLNFDNLISDTQHETGLIIPEYKKDLFRKLIDINQENFIK